MPAESRRLLIMDYINRTGNGVVSVADLALMLGVSEMTVRRDLDWLEQRTLLTRVHGGAVAAQYDFEKPFGDRIKEYNPQKKSIGWAAAQLVKDGDRIILDAGTTTQQIAQHLSTHSNLTVITNNIPISTDLARFPKLTTILLGGELKHQELCTVGSMVKQGLSILSVDKVFLSASGFSVRSGVTDADMREVEVKQAMMQAANEVILVADSSKFGKAQLVKICSLQAVKKIVTDDVLPVSAIDELEAEGVKVITPDRVERSADPL
jgi:DeoR family transcriptional regulator, fructose operon transcriptional repressor